MQSSAKANECLLLFNPNVELELYNKGPLPKATQQIVQSLETLPLFLSKKDDIVLVQKEPAQSYLQHLQSLRFQLPQFVSNRSQLQNRQINGLKAWAKSPNTKRDWKDPMLCLL